MVGVWCVVSIIFFVTSKTVAISIRITKLGIQVLGTPITETPPTDLFEVRDWGSTYSTGVFWQRHFVPSPPNNNKCQNKELKSGWLISNRTKSEVY